MTQYQSSDYKANFTSNSKYLIILLGIRTLLLFFGGITVIIAIFYIIIIISIASRKKWGGIGIIPLSILDIFAIWALWKARGGGDADALNSALLISPFVIIVIILGLVEFKKINEFNPYERDLKLKEETIKKKDILNYERDLKLKEEAIKKNDILNTHIFLTSSIDEKRITIQAFWEKLKDNTSSQVLSLLYDFESADQLLENLETKSKILLKREFLYTMPSANRNLSKGYYNTGINYARRKIYEEALEAFNKAIELDPVSPPGADALLAKGSLLITLGQLDYGLIFFEKYLIIEKDEKRRDQMQLFLHNQKLVSDKLAYMKKLYPKLPYLENDLLFEVEQFMLSEMKKQMKGTYLNDSFRKTENRT